MQIMYILPWKKKKSEKNNQMLIGVKVIFPSVYGLTILIDRIFC